MSESNRESWRRGRAVLALLCAPVLLLPARDASAQQVVLMSKGTATLSDSAGGSVETEASVSADGKLVVFVSEAADLVPGQIDPPRSPCDNGDVFLYDVSSGDRFLISHREGDDKTAADCGSYAPKLSADGKFVAFVSAATNLALNQSDTPNTADVFLYNVANGQIVLVSHANGSVEKAGDAPSGENGDHSISGNGQFVAFTSLARDLVASFTDRNGGAGSDVYLFNQAKADPLVLVSHSNSKPDESGDGSAENPAISLDGKFVAFQSLARDHASPQDDSNGQFDVFLADVSTAEVPITLVSHAYASPVVGAGSAGTPSDSTSPVISRDGRFVAYVSLASNIPSSNPGDDTNREQPDVFLYDSTVDPRFDNLLVSRKFGESVISGDQGSDAPSISGDGDFVVYASLAKDLVEDPDDNGFQDVYLFDVAGLKNRLVSHVRGDPRRAANGDSGAPLVSFDGSSILYASTADDLTVETDGNGVGDAFVYDIAADADSVLVSFVPFASQTGDGPSGDAFTFYPHSISGDGKVVAYTSGATDLISSPFVDGDGVVDVMVFDGSANKMASVRASAGGTGGANNLSLVTDRPLRSISDDGRYAAFVSYASNLIDGGVDTNGAADVFLYDRVNDSTVLVSHVPGNEKLAGNFFSDQPVVTRDGRLVVFRSQANNLVGGTDTNGATDIFVYSVGTGAVILASHAAGAPTIAANGASTDAVISRNNRFLAFSSAATNLGPADGNVFADVYRYALGPGTADLVSRPNTFPDANGASGSPAINADGTRIAFASTGTNLVASAGDVNGTASDVFLWREAQPLTLVSRQLGQTTVTSNGASSQPSIEDAGGYVAFLSMGTDMVPGQVDVGGTPDVFIYFSNEIWVVSRSTAGRAMTTGAASDRPLISADGLWVVFQGAGVNLVCGQVEAGPTNDVFLFDVGGKNFTPSCPDDTTIANRLVSHIPGSNKLVGNAPSFQPSVSSDGAFVAYTSQASNLATGQVDPGIDQDVFLWSRGADRSLVASRALVSPTTAGNGPSQDPVVSGNGGYVAFDSFASDLILDDPNGFRDAFLFEAPFTDIRVTKDDSLTTAIAGSSITYLITVTNDGPVDAVGVLVNDNFNDTGLGAQLASVTWTCTGSGGATCVTPSGSGDIVNHAVSLPVGSFVTYAATATLLGVPASGDLINTACATPPASVIDVDSVNNCATDTDTIAYDLDLTLDISDVPDPVFVNGFVNYQLVATNSGPSTSVEGGVLLVIPELLTGATFIAAGSSPECFWIVATDQVQCGSANITFVPGTPYVATIQVQAQSTAPNQINVSGNVNGMNETGTVDNNDDDELTTVVAATSFIEILTVTSKNGTNTLEWLTPPNGGPGNEYNNTKILRKEGGCPTGPNDGTAFVLTGFAEPGAGAKGIAVDTGLTNGTVYCYQAYVDRNGGNSVFSPPKEAKGRPMNNSASQPEERVQWAFATGATATTPPTVGTGGIVAVSNDRGVYSMVRGNGATSGLWPAAFWPLRLQGIAQNRSPVVPVSVSAGASQVVFIGAQDGSVYAVDAIRGKNTGGDPAPVWQSPLLGPANTRVQAAPAGIFQIFGSGMSADLALVGTRAPGGSASEFHGLQVANPGGGSDAWVYDGSPDQIGIVSGGASVDYATKRVYFASRPFAGGDPTLWCAGFTESSAATCPGFPKTTADGFDQSPVLRNGRLYIADNSSTVYCFDVTQATAPPCWGPGFDPTPDGPGKGFVFPDRLSPDLYLTTTNRVFGLTDSGAALAVKSGWPAAGLSSVPNPSIPLFGRIAGVPYIWVGSSNGRLYQIQADNPIPANIKWVALGGAVAGIGAPSLDLPNEIVLAGSENGVIYAVKVPLP